ncbi:ASB_HP2_G0031630.mRNA.1.CDS.1 [Saccharomyces cerevisiae]|nr:ASB_HP2_G0031630.mRNA.1.CDS.1 [Saccharomyces cerevisiae]CAI6611172.1 ASB_HP2_G0031630.mRNA.1.CDS.1 [Saccharomyces cerevisiae]
MRLCGPYSHGSYPFSDFPPGLTKIIKSYTAFVNGGHRVDGSEIQPLDEKMILEHARKIMALGIKNIAIVGIFAIIDKSHEQRAAELIRKVIPDGNIVMSHTVSGIGYLSRENASILNASIMSFAALWVLITKLDLRRSDWKPLIMPQELGQEAVVTRN